MRNGRLELEIRRLPGVLAVDLQPEALSVLAEPSCDAIALGATLEALLASRGLPQEIRILGGMIPVSGRHHRLPAFAMGGIGGIALLGVATAAALQGTLPLPEFQQDHRLPPVAGAPAPTTTAPAGPRLRIVPGDQPAWAAAEPTLVIPANPLATTPTTSVVPRPVDAVLATVGNPVSVEPETPTTTTPTVPEAPKPVVTTPKPVVTTPKPVVTTPKPVVTTPKPVVTTPKPVVTTPKPVVTTPKPKPKPPPVVVTVPRPTTTHGHHECGDDGDDHEHGWGKWRHRSNPPGGPRMPRPCKAEGPKDR